MRLRTRIQAPERFEDEDYNTSAANDETKPAFPRLLKQQTTSFNPHLPPAVFPSAKQGRPREDRHRMLKDFAEPADADMMDIDRPFDNTFLPTVHRRGHLNTQAALATSPNEVQNPLVAGRSFLDDAETSGDDEHEVQQDHADRTVADRPQRVYWTQLAPSLQVEIFENLCDSRYGHATYDILGLSHDELYNVMKHLWTRNKQVIAEDRGIQELQQAQLHAILRKDHSSMLNTDSWRDHVAYTRRHLPQIPTSFDYFICNEADMEMARTFLNQRGIGSQVLGEWDRNKKDDGVTKWIHIQALEASKGREDVDSGYTSEAIKKQSRHTKQAMDQLRVRKLPLETSNRARKAMSVQSSLRRKRPQSMLDTQQDAAIAQDYGVDLSTAKATSSALAALKMPGSAMSLPARGSHRSPSDEEGTTLARGGSSQDSDVPHTNEDEQLQIHSPPSLKINPPISPPNKEDLDVGNTADSPGKRAITLKISPVRLLKVRATMSSNVVPSSVGPQEVLTSPVMTNVRKVINDKPRDNSSRPQQPMPAARMPLTWQGPGKLDTFSLKLLETQRRAAGLYTPPAFPALLSEEFNRQTSTSPKRLRLNPPQDIIAGKSSNDTQMYSPYGLAQPQRKDSTSSQEAPPWSPITQRSNSFSRPPSRKESYKDESQLDELPSISSPEKAIQLSAMIAMTSKMPKIPHTPPHTKIDHMKPNITENGSPVPALASNVRKPSIHPSEEPVREEAKPKIRPGQGPSQSFELPQTPGKLSSHPVTPFRASIFAGPQSTDPIRTYGSSLLGKWPSGSQYSPPRQLIANPGGPIPMTLKSAQDAEQSTIEALLSIFQKRHHMTEKRLDTGGQALSAEKASKAFVVTSATLQESEMKTGKDGNVRPRTYRKSEKQTQKELSNAAARASLGKAGSIGMKRTVERRKTDAKGSVPPAAKYTSQTATHVETPLGEDEHAEESRPFVREQEVVETRINESAEDLDIHGESSIELPDIVTRSKRIPFGPRSSKEAQKTKKVASDGESYDEDGTSDASMAIKPIVTPRGKRLAIDRAKAAVQGYQTAMAMRGKSALTDMAWRSRKAQKSKPTTGREPVLRRNASLKLSDPAEQEKGEESMSAAMKTGDEIERQNPSSPTKKVTLKMSHASDSGERPAQAKLRKKKNGGLTGELSVQNAEGGGKIKSFRGNQYLNADRTPRVKKESASPGL